MQYVHVTPTITSIATDKKSPLCFPVGPTVSSVYTPLHRTRERRHRGWKKIKHNGELVMNKAEEGTERVSLENKAGLAG